MRNVIAAALAATMLTAVADAAPVIRTTQLYSSNFGTPVTDQNAEIPAYDAVGRRVFVSAPGFLRYLDARTGAQLGTIDFTSVFPGSSPNSVAISGTNLAVALQDAVKTNAGRVLVYDTTNLSAAPRVFTVGSLPDQLTFTPDGTRILVANEGEPNSYSTAQSVDPEGSISIINLQTNSVQTAGFGSFNAQQSALRAQGVRIYGPNATVAQDLEPEYIAISPDGTKAFVTLQENNAIAVVDIASATVTDIKALGYKNMATGFDLNDSNGAYAVTNRATGGTFGLYQPDGIASFTVGGRTYYITANEGDAREWDNVGGPGINSDVQRAGASVVNGGYGLAAPFNRINVIRPGLLGVTNASNTANGVNSNIYMNGARSFSIYDDQGNRLFDSGNDIERIVGTLFPANFADSRSDDKGPEPEDVKIGQVGPYTIAFVGLERANSTTNGLILMYDLTNFASGVAPTFLGGISSAQLARPEGLVFFKDGFRSYLGAADEQTNNFVLFQIQTPAPAALALFGLGAGLVALRRKRG
jgi:DNA-binding beta-propeller fold protein YncE